MQEVWWTVDDFVTVRISKFKHQSTIFTKERATGSISINYKLQVSIDFHNVRNLVRDQGVGGSNPLSPIKFFQIN